MHLNIHRYPYNEMREQKHKTHRQRQYKYTDSFKGINTPIALKVVIIKLILKLIKITKGMSIKIGKTTQETKTKMLPFRVILYKRNVYQLHLKIIK